jgi:hypothetical protein
MRERRIRRIRRRIRLRFSSNKTFLGKQSVGNFIQRFNPETTQPREGSGE